MSGALVVGGGIAGQSVCEELRRRDAEVPITLVYGEAQLPYDVVAVAGEAVTPMNRALSEAGT